MGKAQSSTSRQAMAEEAMLMFKQFDVDGDADLSEAEWERAFGIFDEDKNKILTRKEWCIRNGSTHLFDACKKKVEAQITKEEWMQLFKDLDTDHTGSISAQEWLARRPVFLALMPLGLGCTHWGVMVGDEFDHRIYEVIALDSKGTEMVVAGPSGVIAMGEFAEKSGRREQWLEKVRLGVKAKSWPGEAWKEQEMDPTSRPRQHWGSVEGAGGTSLSDEEIEEWIVKWVKEHPAYISMDAFGRECNDHNFSLDFIHWVTGTPYQRMTDGQKGRALAYGGLALLAGAGMAYLSLSPRPSPAASPRTSPRAKPSGSEQTS